MSNQDCVINKRFIKCEVKKIDLDKWYEGVKIHHDPHSDNYEGEWIKHNAATYRDQWFSSLCSRCKHWEDCGWVATKRCQDFEKDE